MNPVDLWKDKATGFSVFSRHLFTRPPKWRSQYTKTENNNKFTKIYDTIDREEKEGIHEAGGNLQKLR